MRQASLVSVHCQDGNFFGTVLKKKRQILKEKFQNIFLLLASNPMKKEICLSTFLFQTTNTKSGIAFELKLESVIKIKFMAVGD